MEGIRNKELIDYIEQNKVSCARIDGVFLIGIKDVDIIIDRVKNSVVLADVSNRRELLIAFLDDINARSYEHIKTDEGKVDAFISNL